MSETGKKALLIIAGLLVCVLTFFLVYQPNSEEIVDLESQSAKLHSEVNRLTALQVQVDQMKPLAEAHESEMDMYFAEYPSRMTEQKAIYNVYRMMVDTGMDVTAVQPNRDMTFMQSGTLVSEDAAVASDNSEGVTGAAASAEISPETKVPINEILGKYTTFQLQVEGKRCEIYDALDWISENSEHMSVGNVALSRSGENNRLVGTIDVNFYSMNGNGIAYVDPDVSDIEIGSIEVFGTKQKDGGRSKGGPTYKD